MLWSEHCGYKHSAPLLGRLPSRGSRVLQGPGENAGVVDLGDGIAVAFKVESHNHPSAVEPFQGAATGVGGIIRDVVAMGARPIALLDGLRFGAPDWHFRRAVAGYTLRGKPSILGLCSGAVAGLATITPASGFVTANGAVIIGILAGVVPFLACTKLKAIFKYDDALDTFGVHAVGGTLGALLTGPFATASVNGNLNTNLKDIVGKSS